MSGHSKWATTKHKKAVVDARRSKLFAKLVKSIEVAARTGGADPSGNPTLADAIAKAKSQSVPNDNIDRAVKRGSGALGDAVSYESVTYECYGPGGTALLVECLTDNRNRAAAEVRTTITRNGGRVADPGSVAYLFERRAVLVVEAGMMSGDDVLLALIDAGAEDVVEGEYLEVHAPPAQLRALRAAAEEAGLTLADAGVYWIAAQLTPELSELEAAQRLVEALEDLDDVQDVWANFAPPEDVE